MANPQKENGYTAIANELLEHLIQMKLNGSQLRVLLFIMRRTYGFNKKSAPMSLSFIANGVGIRSNAAYRALHQLEDMKMISITHGSTASPQIISIEKNYQKWVYPNLSIPESEYRTVPKYGESTIPKSEYQKRNNIKKHNKETYCACAFFEALWSEYPNKKGKARVSKKSLAEINRIGYEEMHRALERYKADKPDWQQWQNGSTFFNSGYVDYLDAAYETENEAIAETDEETDGGGYHWQ